MIISSPLQLVSVRILVPVRGTLASILDLTVRLHESDATVGTSWIDTPVLGLRSTSSARNRFSVPYLQARRSQTRILSGIKYEPRYHKVGVVPMSVRPLYRNVMEFHTRRASSMSFPLTQLISSVHRPPLIGGNKPISA